MAIANAWPTIHAERKALAADLSTLAPEQWSTPSLCPNWTVHDVLGHLTATAKMTPPKFFGKFARSGFRFHDMSAKEIAQETAGGPAATLAEFRRQLDATTHPPGPIDAMVGEAIVHGEDIRRPLGIAHIYPMDTVTQVADFFSRSNLLIGSKQRIAGLTLRATDTTWSKGTGPEVSGPMLSLLLAMTGRGAALADLSGDGLPTLRARMPSSS
jgi:uncharacterized protein (TIGR03083 family)